MTDLAPAPLSSRRWWVCLLLMFATTINYMDRVALNQLALRIKTYFALSNTQYSLLESRLLDRVRHRRRSRPASLSIE